MAFPAPVESLARTCVKPRSRSIRLLSHIPRPTLPEVRLRERERRQARIASQWGRCCPRR